MKFFSVSGCEISRDDFVSLYGTSYYIGNEKIVPGISRSSRFVEGEIDRLLREGIKSKLDIVHILAWKIGKVKHPKSDSKFVYAKDWKDAEKYKATRYGKTFEIENMAGYVADNITMLKEKAEQDPQSVLFDLKNVGVAGLGSVYLITLLYFISGGKYPIYDRFAAMAVDAIRDEKLPGEEVRYHYLPDKNSKSFDTIMQDHMIPYIQKLNEIFGNSYQDNRNIDRALWVYGHLFKQS